MHLSGIGVTEIFIKSAKSDEQNIFYICLINKLNYIKMKVKLFNLRNFIPVIITGLILSSCSKDSTPADDLVGTWTIQSATFNALIGSKALKQYLIDELSLTDAEAQQFADQFNQQMQQSFTGTIQMKSDNTYTSTMGGTPDTGTWSLSSDNKKLTIDSSTDSPVILDVIELTSSKLQLRGTDTQTEDLNGDDTPETINVTIDLIFTK
jgi:hypothetical protein